MAVKSARPTTTVSAPEGRTSRPSASYALSPRTSTTLSSGELSKAKIPEALGDTQDFRGVYPSTTAIPRIPQAGPSSARNDAQFVLKRKREADGEEDKENLPVEDDFDEDSDEDSDENSDEDSDDDYTSSSPLPSPPQKRVKIDHESESEQEEEQEEQEEQEQEPSQPAADPSNTTLAICRLDDSGTGPCQHELTGIYDMDWEHFTKKHGGRVGRRFPCAYSGCTETFAYKSSLSKHVVSFHWRVHGTQVYCTEPNCGKPFARKDTLTVHKRKIHGI